MSRALSIAVTADLLEAGGQGAGAAVEEGDPVAAEQQAADQLLADEESPADDEDVDHV